MAWRSAASAISWGVLRLVAPFRGHEDAQVLAEGLGCLFECAAGDRGDTAAVPVEPQHAAEGLEPPRIGQPAEHLGRAELVDDGHGHGTGQAGHPLEEPGRGLAGVERKLRESALHGEQYICGGRHRGKIGQRRTAYPDKSARYRAAHSAVDHYPGHDRRLAAIRLCTAPGRGRR